jgi:hypothetical protein
VFQEAFKLWNTGELIGLSDNAGGWAKFERPKNACVFEGGRIWSSPHGRARAQARSSRGRDPEEPPQSGGDAAPIRVLSEGPFLQAPLLRACRMVVMSRYLIV